MWHVRRESFGSTLEDSIRTLRHEAERVARYVKRFGISPRVHFDGLALQMLAPLSTAYLPWTDMSMRPSGVVTLLNDIMLNRRRRVVECGSGVSTFYMAKLLSQSGGHLFTIEDDPEWGLLLRQILEEHQLEDHVSIIIAPLAPTDLALEGNHWYAQDELHLLIEGPPIELLLVDGPQAAEPRNWLSRYPAVPFFRGNLSEDCTIVLDDIDRRGEQEVARRWEAQLGRRFSRRPGGIAVSAPGRMSI